MKTAVQRLGEVLAYSGSLAAGASISGSAFSAGFGRLVGIQLSTASSVAGSGLAVYQSANLGLSWHYVTACQISACGIYDSAFSIEIVGNAVKVNYQNGNASAASAWALWQLRPI